MVLDYNYTSQALAALDAIRRDVRDSEDAHKLADAVLLTLLRKEGYGEVADAFEAVREAVVFWYA